MTTFHDRPVVLSLDPEKVEKGSISELWVDLVANGIGQSIFVPAIIARGVEDGPVLGITAVVHGNELNGLSVIQKLFGQIDVAQLRGSIVAVPVINVPSILQSERRFIDGEDLNRIFPGKPNGDRSEVYAHRIIDRVIRPMNYLLDLHTASFGRINSYYIRADMNLEIPSKLARLQNAQIILNNEGSDGTLRSAAEEMGIHSITVEVGDPNKFQKGMIRSSLTGIFNVLSYLKMIDEPIEEYEEKHVFCDRSYWIYTDRGGILEVYPALADNIKKGDKIAKVKDVFGKVIREYFAPGDGIVIGKSTHPVNQTGGRIIHFGEVKK